MWSLGYIGGAGNRIVGGGTEGDPTGAKGGIGDEVKAPIGPVGDLDGPSEDASGTIPATRHGSLIVALIAATGEPTIVGDRVVARLALRLLLHVLSMASSY